VSTSQSSISSTFQPFPCAPEQIDDANNEQQHPIICQTCMKYQAVSCPKPPPDQEDVAWEARNAKYFAHSAL
jgi:hypothetical protein